MKKYFLILSAAWLLAPISSTPSTGVEPPPLPAITGFSPASGPSGTAVQITGTDLGGVTAVKFNGVTAPFSALVGNLTAIVPDSATTGFISVTTTNGTATSAQAFTVTQRSGPVVASFSPATGKVGASVQIRGTNLIGVTNVKFNGANATYTLFSGIIFATVPASATTGPITVATATGTFTTTESFVVELTAAPLVTGFTPATGEAGTPVQIQGSNLTGVSAVKFGEVAAAFSVFGGSLLATVPTNAVTGPITVVTASGNSTSTAVFTVTKRGAPLITAFSPISGEVGASVEIRGSDLIDVKAVQFNGANASFTNLPSGLVFAIVPTNAASGPITIATPLGTNTSSQSFTLINPRAPQITSLLPDRGEAGILIDIRGTNLTGIVSVKFNGLETEFLEFQSERLLAFVPKNATTGPITVTTRAGVVTSSVIFTVTGSPPAITPPSLSIRATTQGQVEVAWPTNSVGFVLQSTDEFASSTRWTLVDLPAVTVQERFVITTSLSAQQKFFRLVRP
ncbi:MAG: hypothetical protein HYY23_07820 [Verrucomicrobia bacterium]|nr:hypothetical protein [Verrucomicrobiota bacterium]